MVTNKVPSNESPSSVLLNSSSSSNGGSSLASSSTLPSTSTDESTIGTSTFTTNDISSSNGTVPSNIQHLYENPHVLFPEPPIACFARRDNWSIKTVESANDYVEIILSLEQRSFWSSFSRPVSSYGTVIPPTQAKDTPMELPSPIFFHVKRLLIACLFGIFLFTFWNPSSFSLLTKDTFQVTLVWTLLYEIIIRCILAYFVSIILIHPKVIQESVAAIRGLGLQITTVYENGRKDTTFIDSYSIRSIIVNEGIRSCNIIYYLAVIASGRRTMLLLYEYARPRLPVIAYIYSKLVRVLNE